MSGIYKVMLTVISWLVVAAVVTGEYGTNNYTEFIRGDDYTVIIISASHGGNLKPSNIPNRRAGCYNAFQNTCDYHHGCGTQDTRKCKVSTVQDYYTLNIAKMLRNELKTLTGSNPHLIINHLYREKMDANRNKYVAAQYNADAEQAWEDYHGYLREAKELVKNYSDVGIVFDLHGQTHSEAWIELGYLISKSKLDSSTPSDRDPVTSSVRHLVLRTGVSFNELLSGYTSLGSLMIDEGLKTVPSKAYKGPDGGNYYSGGYITLTHGSRDGGTFDAIQIEIPRTLRGVTKSPPMVPKVASAIVMFVNMYYNQSTLGDAMYGTDASKDGTTIVQTTPTHESTIFKTTPIDGSTVAQPTQKGMNNYTEFNRGDDESVLIIAASHGGNVKPADIPTRVAGCYNGSTCDYHHNCGTHDNTAECNIQSTREYYTMEIARELTNRLAVLLNKRPHLVLCYIHKEKMDANTGKDVGAQYNGDAEQAWDDYHRFIRQAKDLVTNSSAGVGLFLDIHGTTHSEGWVELGYYISARNLDSTDPSKRKPNYSSIRHLASRAGISFDNLLHNTNSLGARIMAHGYKAVPSDTYTGPNGGNYYGLGYSIKKHGSRDGGTVDAIQLQFPSTMRGPDKTFHIVPHIAAAIDNFVETYYSERDEKMSCSNIHHNNFIIIITTLSSLRLSQIML